MILTQIEGVAAGDEVVDGLFRQCRYLCSLSLAMIAVLPVIQRAPSRVLQGYVGVR
ncbi:MAG: hypothetical protein II592_06785 [Muribaculaceae bacterium]|nr:hypothetical protein [Muribaculaceae bacterium]